MSGWLIAIGASAGGVQTLMTLVRALRPELPATVLVVVHVRPCGTSMLPQILHRAGRLPASHAQDGEPLVPGRIYIAPPDHHMRIDGERIRLDRGPLENRSRPAIDPLFRSMARCCPRRGIGVVLTGNLDDGSAGLAALKESGGIAIVQDPEDALHPDMPRHALTAVHPDHITTLSGLGGLLTTLVAEPPSMKASISPGTEGDPPPGAASPT